MAKNQGAGFARMDPEERDRFAEGRPLNPDGAAGDEKQAEVEFDEKGPRDADRMGRHTQPESAEREEEEETEVREAGPQRKG